MNIFLEFKNKNLEHSFYGNLGSYTAHMMITHTILAISALPMIPINQYFLSDRNFQKRIFQLYGWVSFFVVLLLLGILARRFRARLEKHKKTARWVLDLFYTGLTGLLSVLLWDAMQKDDSSDIQYFLGWLHCLTCTSTLGIISRWYLKAAAYVSLIMPLAIEAYLKFGHLVFLSVMVRISLFLSLSTYFQERNDKNRFIEKYKLHVETLILKEILNQTTEGIIICDLKRAVQFRNSSYGKFSWWDENRTFIQNLEQIHAEQQINMVS
jgi:PAS domain-containing protein